jgi:hypothetical protein
VKVHSQLGGGQEFDVAWGSLSSLRQKDLVVALYLCAANWAFFVSSIGSRRTKLNDTIEAQTDMTTGLEHYFNRVAQTNRTLVCRFFFRRSTSKLVAEFQVVVVGLLSGLEEEQGCKGCEKQPKKFENPFKKVADISALLDS